MLVVKEFIADWAREIPGERPLEALVKSTLMTFNDANVTGNYAVFHAKLSKPFRQQYTVERLKETFKEFSEKKRQIAEFAHGWGRGFTR